MHNWDEGGAAWWWMLPMMFVFLGAVIAVAWALHNANRSRAPQGPQRDPQAMTAEEVLAEHLARREADAAEYRERLETLGQHA